ncbi:hypothetical protein MPTK2_3g20010 [Marchantia polymorpha subsp. ruderalis]
MLQDAMPGEAFVSGDCQIGSCKPSTMDDPNTKLQEMAEKLEKSEAGRKKLRQAITMLKEKMEATEKVLQVNETLRQECEKERLRAESERKKAEEEKALRLQIEKEGLSVKEQLARVLQRLDAVERNSKSDRLETDRIRGEMKQAMTALGGALQVAEAAQVSLQGLEKTVQDKVNVAVSTSSKALSLAQSVSSDAKAAHGVAASAEKNSQLLVSRVAAVQKQSGGFDLRLNTLQQESSKALSVVECVKSDAKAAHVAAIAAEKMSQSLVSRVAAVQKENAAFTQRLNVLQQELRTRYVDVGVSSSGTRGLNTPVAHEAKKVPGRGMVLSKNQHLNGAGLDTPKPSNGRSVSGSTELNHSVGQTETLVGLTGVSTQAKCHPSESLQVVDSGSSSGCTSTFSRELDVVKRNKVCKETGEPSVAAVPKRPLLTSPPVSTAAPRFQKPANVPVRRLLDSRPLKCTTGKECIPSASKVGSDASGTVKAGSSSGLNLSRGELVESHPGIMDICVPQTSGITGLNVASRRCSVSQPTKSDFTGRQKSCGSVDNEENCSHTATLKVIEDGKASKSPEKRVVKGPKGQRRVKLPAALLKDITKLFCREKKVHTRMEAKFMALEKVLQTGWNNGSCSQHNSESLPLESRKRKRRENGAEKNSKRRLNEACDQALKKDTRPQDGLQIEASQVVRDKPGAAVKRSTRNKSKDSRTADPATPVQSTPPFALPKVSESVVAEIFMTAKVQEQASMEVSGGEIRPLASVSHPVGERRSVLVTPLREEMETGGGIHSEGVNWCQDVGFDEGGTNKWTVTCSSDLPGTAGKSGDERERTHDMDIDRCQDKGTHDIYEITGLGWDTESDLSEDEFDPEWWTTKRILLSPTLPELHSSTDLDGGILDTSIACPSSNSISLEEMALCLDVLPPVPGEGLGGEIIEPKFQFFSDAHSLDESKSGDSKVVLNCAPMVEGAEVQDLRVGKVAGGTDIATQCLDESFSGNTSGEGNGVSRPEGGEVLLLPSEGCEGMNISDTQSLDESIAGNMIVDVMKASRLKGVQVDVLPTKGCQAGSISDTHLLLESALPKMMADISNVPSLERVVGQGLLTEVCEEDIIMDEPVSATKEVDVHTTPKSEDADVHFIGSKGREAEMIANTHSQHESTSRTTRADEDVLSRLEGLKEQLLPSEECEGMTKDVNVHYFPDGRSLGESGSNVRTDANKEPTSQGDGVQTLPSVFAALDFLQYFLIQGGKRPDTCLDSAHILLDCNGEVAKFQVPASTSDVKTKTAIEGSKLLASLCLKAEQTDYLRKCIHLILRFCDKDSTWLLAAISSFVSVCGKQLLSVDEDDIAGQAVLVVISELLNDAEASEATGTDAHSENVDHVMENRHDKTSTSCIGLEENFSSHSSNLHVLRETLGECKYDLNFEVFLPKILQKFVDVVMPNFIRTPSDHEHYCAERLCIGHLDKSDRSLTASSATSNSTVPTGPSEEASIPLCDDKNGLCWHCSYSDRYNYGPHFVKRKDPEIRSGHPRTSWEQKFHEITHALELIAFHLGWEWTYNELIVENLWRLVQPGADEVTVALVAKSLGIFGRLGIEMDGTELQGVEALRQILNAILRSENYAAGVNDGTQTFPYSAQVAAAEALLDLSSDIKRDPQNTVATERGPPVLYTKIAE